MYLFAWSNVLWPQQIPNAGSSEEQHSVDDFRKTLPEVRRALANVPTYMILDDHEVTDDWFMNREWCNLVLERELGKRIIQNALLAYALFQAWGNTPLQFSETDASGESGRELLQAAEAWNGSQS